ncbi:MAG: hypothetical protein Q4C95_06290 [Planctomycetia bacterium]|nr:hypothetical protein [Planctomycetia bacterium]
MKKKLLNLSNICLFILILSIVSSKLFAQNEDAQKTFDDLVVQMTPSDPSNAEEVQKMENAQQTWMRFCLEEAGRLENDFMKKETNQIMTTALAQDFPVTTKVWLLHILGWTATENEVDAIAICLNDPEYPIADEAARTLAMIPGSQAEKSLLTALETVDANRQQMIQDAIRARSINLSIAFESESPMNLVFADLKTVDDWMAHFSSLSEDQKARTLAALTARKEKKYINVAVESLTHENKDIQKAAALMLEKTASVKELPVLLTFLFKTDRTLGIRILSNIVAEGMDQAIFKTFQNENNPDYLIAIAEIMSRRQMKSSVSEILKIARKDQFPNRLALLNSAEQLADSTNINDFVDAMIKIPAGADRDRAEQVIARLCQGDAMPVIQKINPQNIAILLPALGRIGGEKALEQINRGLKSNNESLFNLSIRALCNWPNAVVATQLLELAQNQKINESNRIQTLRAFARVISLPDDQIGIEISGQEKLEMLKKAMTLATRNEERRLILDRSSAVRSVETVAFALEYIDVSELSANACQTIVELAHHDYLRKENKEVFLSALDKVLATTNDQGLKDRAQNYKNAIK